MNKQKSKLTAKKKNNTNKTLKHKNLVGGYGIKTKSSKKRTNTRRTRRSQDDRMFQEGEGEEGDDNQEDYTYPPVPPTAFEPIPPSGPTPAFDPVPAYVPPTPYGDVPAYIPPPAFESIPAYVQPTEIPPVPLYVPPPAFEPIPSFQNSTSSEEPVIIPQEEPVINPAIIPQEEPVINPAIIPQEEPVIILPEEQVTNLSIPPYVPPPVFDPIPAYVQPTEIPPVPLYDPPPPFAPIPPFQNSTSSEEPPEEPVINQEPQSENIQNGFTETIIPNNQPPTNNNINVELCPTIIEVGKNINHKYMFPSQFPVITNFYKQIPENMINNKKSI